MASGFIYKEDLSISDALRRIKFALVDVTVSDVSNVVFLVTDTAPVDDVVRSVGYG